MQTELLQDPQAYQSVGVAARLGDLVGLQEMVWHGRPIDVFDNRGWSPVHEAAFAGNSGCLEFLLRRCVDPNWISHAKETALLLACRQGHQEAMVALINAQADVDLATNEGYTPLWEALHKKNYLCFKMLIKKDADVNVRIYTGQSCLHLAAERGVIHCVNLLLQHGADVDCYADHNLSPLFYAAQYGHFECVRLLLEVAKDRGVDHVVNAAADDGATPLLIAAQEGHHNIVALLLHFGADPEIKDIHENSKPLQYALLNGHIRCVELLLPVTDISGFHTSDFETLHPLVLALRHGNLHILRLITSKLNPTRLSGLPPCLLTELGHLVSTIVPVQTCNLLCLIEPDWPVESAKFLLDSKVSPDAHHEHELPPLLVALWTNNVPLLQLLLMHRASPNIYYPNVTGNVAMLMAFQKDIERDLTSMIMRNSRQSKFRAFLIWQLFLAGAESHSLFDFTDTVEGNKMNRPAMTNLFGLMFHMFHRNENLVPVLALLMYISDHACLKRSNLSHFEEHDKKILEEVSEKTNLLSHRCRRVIVKTLGRKNNYNRKAVEKLNIPQVLQDYLMFSELGTPLQDMILQFITD